MELGELHRTIHGRTAEREVASGEMYRKTRKHGFDAHKTSDLARPGLDLVSGYFRVLPALDAGDRRGSLPGLPYCCSAGLTLATVVGEPHCCSVVTVNTSNTVQLPTLNSSTPHSSACALASARPPCTYFFTALAALGGIAILVHRGKRRALPFLPPW